MHLRVVSSMNWKRPLAASAAFVLCFWFAHSVPAQSPKKPPALDHTLLIQHVHLVDVTSGAVRDNTDVLVAGGHIAQMGPHLKRPNDAQLLDGSGKFLIPGLWDMHVHLAGLSADPKWSRDVLLPLLVANGVTGVRDMGGSLPALLEWKKQIAAGALVGPQIFASGPMLDGTFEDPSVLLTRNPQEAAARVQELKAMGADFVKILSGLDRDTYFAVATSSRSVGLTFVGHVPPLVGAAEASDAHQKSIEHILYGGIPIACSSTEEVLRQQMAAAMKTGAILQIAKVEDAAADAYDPAHARALWQTLVKNGTWIVPTLISTYTSARLDELVNDDPAAAYLPHSLTQTWTAAALKISLRPEKIAFWKRELARHLELVRQMHAAGVKILAGTDSLDPHNVPGASLAKELGLLVQAGFTPLEALQAATQNPAEFMGRTDVGRISVGARADLVLLDASPLADVANVARIHAVVVGGRALTRVDIDQAFARLKQTAAQP
jgi:imidazolonepropionase-like amidohydrolase